MDREKTVSVGYVEFSHFTDKLESPIFNFLFRIVTPLIYLIIISALLYSLNLDQYVINVYLIVLYYFLIRWIVIFLLNRNQLTNWWRQVFIGGITIALSYILYIKIIIEKKNILPNPDELANELWIIIILFLYAILNKLNFRSVAIFNRQNNFIEKEYEKLKLKYGTIIDNIVSNEKLKCLTYAIIIYENFNRPKIVRFFENISFHLTKKRHSLGIMQFQSNTFISNAQSVKLGTQKIQAKYIELKRTLPLDQQNEWTLKQQIINDYNSGERYLYQVNSIEVILAILKFNHPSYTL